MTMNLNLANASVDGVNLNDEWTEPVSQGVEVFNVEALKGLKVDADLQNRLNVEENDYGYIATTKKTEAVARYIIGQANAGVSSDDALPPITVGVVSGNTEMDGMYLIGGHGRLSGLMHARKSSENGYLDLFKNEKGEDDETPSKDIASNMSGLRVHMYKCANRRDLETLASRENSDAQNGERLTDKELVAQIETALKDPMKAQYKDEALGQRFFDTSGLRAKIYNIRRRMFKKGECGVQQGAINVHGKPMKPSRPGSTTLKKLDILSKQLEEEYNHLADMDESKITAKTYSGFERVVAKWDKAREDAHPWLSDEEREELPKGLDALKERIGYVKWAEKYGDETEASTSTDDSKKPAETPAPSAETPTETTQKPAETNEGEGEGVTTTDDDEAVSETADMAAKLQMEMNSNKPAETPAPSTESTETPTENKGESTLREAFLTALMKDARSLQARLIVGEIADTEENIENIIRKVAEAMATEGMNV